MQYNKTNHPHPNPEQPTSLHKKPSLRPAKSSRRLLSGPGSASTLMTRLEDDRAVGKSPSEVMLEMLEGVAERDRVEPFYSREAEEQLSSMLTNPYKRTSFVEHLQEQLPNLPSSVADNYQLLLILLRNLSKHEVAVSHSSNGGLSVQFDSGVLQRQKQQISLLQEQKARKESEVREIVREYEHVINNLNLVTQQMLINQQ